MPDFMFDTCVQKTILSMQLIIIFIDESESESAKYVVKY